MGLGKLIWEIYNTETAEEIANWGNGLGCGDFRHCDETLFKTKKGQFFLSGEGGPMSKWSRPCGNMTSDGDGIELLSISDALAWCEDKDIDTDTVEIHFNIEEG